MRLKSNKRIISWLLCMMLIVAVAFTTIGCNTKSNGGNKKSSTKTEVSGTQVTEESKENVLGEGKTKFPFSVVDIDGKETNYEINTDKKIVGEALLEVDLISGEESEYGLYVKTVNGITADYDVDKTYWAFYVNGEYASKGVDSTEIEEGATYSFKIEKQ